MSFQLYSGHGVLGYFPKTASVTITLGALARPDGSGTARNATASSLSILGVFQKAVASTDSDFAANTKVPIMRPTDDTLYIADVTGTLTTEMVGEQRGLSADGLSVDATNTTNDQVTIVQFISATKAIVSINGAYLYRPTA